MHSSSNISFDLSSHHSLGAEQSALIAEIEQFICTCLRCGHRGVFVIEGEAGTGKSVLMHTAFARLQTAARATAKHPLYGTQNVLLVNHAEMIKAYHHASETHKNLHKKDYLRPTTYINRMHTHGGCIDVAMIDEGHLLLTRPDPYNRFNQKNQLQEILRLARVVVLVFDHGQVLKFKSLWRKDDLERLLAGYKICHRQIHQQWRMHAGHKLLEWISAIRDGTLLPLPATSKDFDLRIFDDATALYACVRQRNEKYGCSRMIATYDFPYRLDGCDHFVVTGTLTLRWDRATPSARLPWAERPETIDEVGSVYTVQGFDLNYAGVILGPSLCWDADNQQLLVDPQKHEDDGAFIGKSTVKNAQHMQRNIMLNAVSVLLTRARYGLYIYAHDSALRQKLLELQFLRT